MSTDLGSVAALRSETTEVGLDQRDKLQFTMSSVINKGYRPGLIVYNLSYNQYDYSLQLKASSIIYRINYLLPCVYLACGLVDIITDSPFARLEVRIMTRYTEYHLRQMSDKLQKWNAFQALVEQYLPSDYDLECLQELLNEKDKEIKELKAAQEVEA